MYFRHQFLFPLTLSVWFLRYLRLQKPYQPEDDVQEKLVSIVKSVNPKLKDSPLSELLGYKLDDIKFKFSFLSKAHEKLEHRVPNSLLHLVETIGNGGIENVNYNI